MLWLYWRVTGSSATGALYVRSVSGEAAPPTLLNAVPVTAELVARACSGCGSRLKEPDDEVARGDGARIVHGERRIPGGGGHECGRAGHIVSRDARDERAKTRRHSQGK